jgi:hypothetical protein
MQSSGHAGGRCRPCQDGINGLVVRLIEVAPGRGLRKATVGGGGLDREIF